MSALTQTPIRILKIRAGRSKPGLAAQHLKGVELLRDICQARVRGSEIGSTEIEFLPQTIRGGSYVADPKTAGAISLLLQVALPVSIFADSSITLELKGGTNCEMAPQIDFMTEVFRPNLEKFGATFDFDLIRRGYFPKGGGFCKVFINPVKYLNPIELTDFGRINRTYGWSYVAGTLPIKMAHEMVEGAKRTSPPNHSIDIEVYKEDSTVARDNCAGIVVCCETTTNCVLGGSALSSRKESCFVSGQKAMQEILEAISVQACVDAHTQDQLIIFMALAKGKSRIRTVPLTLHTKTAIHVCEMMTKARFNVIDQGKTCFIECIGTGFES